MKVEKVEKIKNQYPKFEEINKKINKRKIGIIATLAITLKSRCIAAISPYEAISSAQIIPGDLVTELEPEFIASKYTQLGYIAMIIVSIISLIIVKFRWKKYDSKQKKRTKIMLGILLVVTLLLVIITMILKSKL